MNLEFKLKHSDLVPESMSSASGNGGFIGDKVEIEGRWGEGYCAENNMKEQG